MKTPKKAAMTMMMTMKIPVDRANICQEVVQHPVRSQSPPTILPCRAATTFDGNNTYGLDVSHHHGSDDLYVPPPSSFRLQNNKETTTHT